MNLHSRICLVLFSAMSGIPIEAHADPGGGARGHVRYKGKAPSAGRIVPTKDPEVCGQPPLVDESLIVAEDGGLRNAIVSIVDPLPDPRIAPKAARLDQVGCRFVPHIQAVAVGSELQIRSSDATFHNVHAFQGGSTRFNVAMPMRGSRSKQKLDQPGLVTLKCDAGHGWMQAFIAVFPHPYFAVTDERGKFHLPNLPEGTHRVKVWHEKLGETTGSVTIQAAKDTTLDFTMGPLR